MVLLYMLLFTGIKAQTVPPLMDKRVRVPMKEVDLTTLGDMITAQTGFILSFNAQKITTQKLLQLRKPSYSVHQLLTMIREATGAEYAIYQDHIIFRRITPKPLATQTAINGYTTKQVNEQRPAGTNRPSVTTAGKQIRIPVKKQAGNVIYHQNATAPSYKGSQTTTHKKRNAVSVTDVPSGRSSSENNSINPGSTNATHIDKETGSIANITPGGAATTRKTGITIDSTAIVSQTGTTPDTTTMASKATNYTASDRETAKSIADNNKVAGISLSPSLTYITPVRTAHPSIKPAAPALLRVTSPAPRQKRHYVYEKPGLFKPFVQAGFGADEVLYANLQAKAGVTLAYGIVSWSTNFSVSGFRYGAGISYPLNNGWLIKLEATTGKLFKETAVRMNDDTTTSQPPLYVNSRLQRISLFAQKNIAPHLSVFAGPVFNHLKSTYQLNTWQLSLATLRTILLTPERDYMTIKPPYTLHRSPPEESADISTWLGFQIGISYRL